MWYNIGGVLEGFKVIYLITLAGNRDFGDSQKFFEFSIDAIVELYKFLAENKKLGFKHIKLNKSEHSTLDDIKKYLEKELLQTKEEDSIFFHLSSHGNSSKKDNLMLCPMSGLRLTKSEPMGRLY